MSKPRLGAPKRVAVGLLAGSLAMFGIALAPSAGATTTVTTQRLAGVNRYGTAAAIAADTAFAAPTTAIVATGENFPDALAASTIAGANAPAPIILTQTSVYTQEAKDALGALKAKGVKTLTIVGGTSAVAQSVEDAIKADGFTTTRVAGPTRYETAAEIAKAANAKSPATPIAGVKTALIATGLNFPDALAGGPIAYSQKTPLLLVNDTVPQATKDAITSLGIKKAIIFGGTAAVSDAVKAQIDALTGSTSDRLAGINRYGTAAAIGDFEGTALGFPITTVIAATGANFPDALAAGPLGGQIKAPIILAPCTTETVDFLDRHSNTIAKLIISGGTAVIDDATVACLKAAAEKTSNDTVGSATTRPELQSASILATTTPANATLTNPAGTTVAYTFDEPVTAATPALFHLYNANGTAADQTGAAAFISSADNRVVNVLFPAINSAALAAALTTATVDLGAVKDVANQNNPEGDAGVGTGGQSTGTAGTTLAPDLRSVGGFRGPLGLAAGADAGGSAVDFTFDQAAFVQNTTGFHLVTTDGAKVDCNAPATTSSGNTTPSGTNVAGGNGTTTITATCPVIVNPGFPSNGQAPSATNIARGYVDAKVVGTTPPSGTVNGVTGVPCNAGVPTATTNQCNPTEASDTPDVPSNTPDLVSATFAPGTTGNPASPDVVTYVFDENVTTTSPTLFGVYNTLGYQTFGNGATAGPPANPQVNGSSVAILFPNGTLANAGAPAVGAFVLPAAVNAVAGTAKPNLTDEVGVANATAATSTPDRTAGPDLVSVALSSTTVGFTTTYTAIYTFDQALAAGTVADADAASLFLYLADGSRMFCSGTIAGGSLVQGTGTGLTTSQVACSSYTFSGSPESGTNVGPATAAQVGSAVLGTVDNGIVATAAGATNPEGAEFTTGGTGTRTA